MKIIKCLSRYLFIVFVMFFISGCRGKDPAVGNFRYNEPKHGMVFEVPSDFIKKTGRSLWSLYEWKYENPQIFINFKANWNQDLKFFPLEMSLDMNFTTYRAKNPDSSIYIENIVHFILPSGVPALSFTAKDFDSVTKGIFVVENNRSYVLSIRYSEKDSTSSIVENAWNLLKKTVNVSKLPDYKAYFKKMISEDENQSMSSIKDFLDYGQQLMSVKEAYSKNYPRAIIEFRKALNIMDNMTPKPAEFNRALRLIYIAKELQRKAYEKHNILLTNDVSLLKWEDAAKEAMLLMDLMEDDRESPMAQIARDNYKFVMKTLKRTNK